MFAATPPRRTSSRSARNDSETRSRRSARRWSVTTPGNDIRWSVAMEPVTALRISALHRAEQCLGAIGPLPGEVGEFADEVAVGRGLRVDRAQEVQVPHDGGWAQVEDVGDR